MKKIMLDIIMLLILLTTIVNAAIEIDIDVKPEYKIGEDIKFTYIITSDKDEIIQYLQHVNCPDVPLAPLNPKAAELKANVPLNQGYTFYSKLGDDIEPQECTIFVSITFPIEKLISKNFTINTNPSFSFNILLDKKIFNQNEEITLDYESSVENPSITATLIYPDEDTKKINLPYPFKAEQLGTYELEATATKEGYKTIAKKTQFGVIEKEADIPYVKEGKMDEEIGTGKEDQNLLGIAIAVTILSIIIIFGYLEYRRTKYQKKLRKDFESLKR